MLIALTAAVPVWAQGRDGRTRGETRTPRAEPAFEPLDLMAPRFRAPAAVEVPQRLAGGLRSAPLPVPRPRLASDAEVVAAASPRVQAPAVPVLTATSGQPVLASAASVPVVPPRASGFHSEPQAPRPFDLSRGPVDAGVRVIDAARPAAPQATVAALAPGAAAPPSSLAPTPRADPFRPNLIGERPAAPGPTIASLPPADGRGDWPRFVPGARGEPNTGPAGDRVTADPGVRLSCLPPVLRRALNDVALRFGPVTVRSTMRGSGQFVRLDAWRGSYHRDCRAADFRVAGEGSGVMSFLRARQELGGVKRYRNGLIHIDDGPRRSW